MTSLVSRKLYDAWNLPDASLNPNLWFARWEVLLDGPWHGHEDKHGLALRNPYYAVVCASAFIIKYGNFRGYEHFAETFCKKVSPHYIGLRVHKERTRTDMERGGYVTDWYVTVDERMQANELEQLYRGAVGIVVTSTLRRDIHIKDFAINNDLNIRTKDNGNSQAQISSQ